MAPQRSFSQILLVIVAAIALAPANGAAGERRVRGLILAVLDDGSLQLEDGRLIRPAGPAAVPQRLLVGQPVEATGKMTGEDELTARRVDLLTVPGGEVRGEAILEDSRVVPRGRLILADGRRLLITAGTRNEEAEYAPGSYITYRGAWAEGGVVELSEVSVVPNRLEEKERKIYEAYRPEFQFVAGSLEEPAALKVGENRYAVVRGRQVQLYFDQLGSRLVPALWRDPQRAEECGINLWFVLVTHQKSHASAFPSGVVVVHSGLLELAENEAQLAFVIAHELAHVLQEHAWRESAYHRKKLQALRWSTAGVGFVVESAIRSGYQRNLEEQADRLALWYLAQAGLDPREGVRMLQRLEARQLGLSGLLWETHRTYPQRRRAAMEELFRLSQAGLAYDSLRRDSDEFHALRALVPSSDLEEARDPARPRR